ncbi:PVC-type heme-binding CxxCH protein [Roseimicrobium gellanilyticum]|uniref:PVC-type heme-binding CxxCH protein n=1 Tax=Roseimicrobium gellanilyticum TaxID=748857 RepID=UPI001474A5A4|nr:PVC-type heme-binding CxxCH protein [Roseimicrobium gellanilyticum]
MHTAFSLPLEVKKGTRIVIIGSTLMERMQEHAWFEGMVLQRFANEEPVIRTLAWPGDEITVQPRPQDYGDLHKHLAEAKADIIIAGYGFNESFRGKEGLADFEHNLRIFLAGLRAHQYNGKSAPVIVLVSPIPQEEIGDANLPGAYAGNERLSPYVYTMKHVAEEMGVGFVDAFNPLREEYQKRTAPGAPVTYNSIHLTDAGYRQFGELLFHGLFDETPKEVPAKLKAAIEDKNRHFLRKYRPLNLFYITGGRKEPYGVVNFPGELQKLEEMTAVRERRAWDIAQGKDVPDLVDDSKTTPLPKITGDRPINEWATPAGEKDAFRVDPRFEVNLFASEEQFPDLAKPIQMRWDTKGRLWVSCSTTYPQVTPGQEPNDKIVILEDTNQDGKADTCKVFAEGLNIPLSFEFAKGGLYCSEQPHLTFLHDADGDDEMDSRSIVLTGFGTEDSHHSLHDFTWTPDGDLIFRESIFHHSSVETPYGPVRARDSSFFRFNPRTQKLTGFGSYMSTNPWGLTFDKWGWHLGSHPVFASAAHALNRPYPEQHVPAGDYFPAYSGTCGQEFIYTKHFPEELQGCFVRVRYKPTNVVELHQWVEHDTHFEEKLIGHLWQSTNLSFIPVDVRFGPRGDLYICDWFNPVKGHMQYSLRDTRRDKTAGRIWRVTAKGRPLDEAPKIAGEPIEKLLDLLKAYEYRTRYTAKMELRMREPREVKTALDKWVAALDEKDPDAEHHKLEALWVYHTCTGEEAPHDVLIVKPADGPCIFVTSKDNEEKSVLLAKLLQSPNPHVRAAAMREVRRLLPDESFSGMAGTNLDKLRKGCNDPSGLVRLEAAITASYHPRLSSAVAVMDLLKHPMDSYTTYALRTSLDALKPAWSSNAEFAAREDLKKFYADSEPKKKRAKEKPDPFDKLNPTVVRIGTVAERMLFTVTEFTVKAGAPVKLVFDNTDATPHNLLIVQPGSEDEVGLAAIEMAKQPEALATMNFTPKSDKIIQASLMLKQGEMETLRFHAPKAPGRYPYLCSFPGHYLVMKGVMIVE